MQTIIHEASITGLFRLILIIVTVYAVYTIFIRFIIPAVMRKYLKDFQQRFTEQNQRERNSQPLKKEGDISISFVDKDKKNSRNPDDGEYVDFEEIK
jgi:hypothetical protein